MPSPNYSSRGGAVVRLIVIHTAEGATSIESLANWFANPANQVSSHVGIDDKPGVVGEYVTRDLKAWTAADANPVATQAELCAFAAWSPDEWHRHPYMLANLAAWIAEEAAAFGIPIRPLTPAQAQSSSAGVCQHKDLGTWGGNHSDAGPGFDAIYPEVLAMANNTVYVPPPTPEPGAAPPWPGRYLAWPPPMDGSDVYTWQTQMTARGWTLAADGIYGPESDGICRQFQAEKGLDVDGVVGPDTWAATWSAPIT